MCSNYINYKKKYSKFLVENDFINDAQLAQLKLEKSIKECVSRKHEKKLESRTFKLYFMNKHFGSSSSSSNDREIVTENGCGDKPGNPTHTLEELHEKRRKCYQMINANLKILKNIDKILKILNSSASSTLIKKQL